MLVKEFKKILGQMDDEDKIYIKELVWVPKDD